MNSRFPWLGLLLLGLVGCGAAVPKSEDWTTFKSPYGYSVSLPKKPTKQTQNADGESVDVYVSDVGKHFFVMTLAVKFDEDIDIKDKELVQQLLENGSAVSLQSIKGKSYQQKNITVAGKYPGLEFSGKYQTPELGESVMRGRVILTNKLVISLNVIATEDYIKLPQVQKCFESLKVE